MFCVVLLTYWWFVYCLLRGYDVLLVCFDWFCTGWFCFWFCFGGLLPLLLGFASWILIWIALVTRFRKLVWFGILVYVVFCVVFQIVWFLLLVPVGIFGLNVCDFDCSVTCFGWVCYCFWVVACFVVVYV